MPPPRPLPLPAHITGDFPRLSGAMARLGGTIMECGATSVTAAGDVARNQCFYFALAARVAAPQEHHAAVAEEIRAHIEGVVRAARPQWAAEDFIG